MNSKCWIWSLLCFLGLGIEFVAGHIVDLGVFDFDPGGPKQNLIPLGHGLQHFHILGGLDGRGVAAEMLVVEFKWVLQL